MENLEALQKRQQGILESMQYITDGDSSDYAGYSKDLMNVNSAIKVEKDYEIQKRKLDIEEVKAKTEQLKAENDIKHAQMESKNTKLGYIVTLVKCGVTATVTLVGYWLISDTEKLGAVTSKILSRIPHAKFD